MTVSIVRKWVRIVSRNLDNFTSSSLPDPPFPSVVVDLHNFLISLATLRAC